MYYSFTLLWLSVLESKLRDEGTIFWLNIQAVCMLASKLHCLGPVLKLMSLVMHIWEKSAQFVLPGTRFFNIVPYSSPCLNNAMVLLVHGVINSLIRLEILLSNHLPRVRFFNCDLRTHKTSDGHFLPQPQHL